MKKKPHLTLILQLKNLFKERNIPYPLIYNSYDLLLMLDKLHITNMYDLCLTTFDFTSLYTNISYHDTTRTIIMSCKLLNLPNFYRDYLLNLNKNETLLLLVIPTISYLGVAMDSYHSQQIVLSLSEFPLFNNTNHPTPPFLTWKNTGEAGFAKLCLCTREETSPGGRFKGSLVGAETL